MKTLVTTILTVVLIVWLLRWVASKLSGSKPKTTTRTNLCTNRYSPDKESTTTLLKVDEGPRTPLVEKTIPVPTLQPVAVKNPSSDLSATATIELKLEPGEEIEIVIKPKGTEESD